MTFTTLSNHTKVKKAHLNRRTLWGLSEAGIPGEEDTDMMAQEEKSESADSQETTLKIRLGTSS